MHIIKKTRAILRENGVFFFGRRKMKIFLNEKMLCIFDNLYHINKLSLKDLKKTKTRHDGRNGCTFLVLRWRYSQQWNFFYLVDEVHQEPATFLNLHSLCSKHRQRYFGSVLDFFFEFEKLRS